jgi:hypothetical protein
MRKQLTVVFMASLLIGGAGSFLMHGSAAVLDNRALKISDSLPGNTAEYAFSFDIVTASNLGSIRFQFCSDTPLVDYPCTPPNGLDASGATLIDQNGEVGFSIDASSDANNIILTRPAAVASTGPATYTFGNVINPASASSYYARITTYATTDGSGAYTDAGGLAYAINNDLDISTYVPPYLLFCGGLTINAYDCASVSGNYLNFGELSSQTTKKGSMQMVLATNADDGYSVFVNGTTMTSGNHVIPPLTSSDVSRPGTSQFGINLVANTTPAVGANAQGPGLGNPSANYGTPDFFRFVPGERIASASDETDFRKYTVSYIANINSDQDPGIYVTTIEYVAVATF